MPARAFEPIFDHQFVRTLDLPAANRPALRDKLRVLQLRQPCYQIGQLAGQLSIGRLRGHEPAKKRHDRRRAIMLERVPQFHKLRRR
jgi:hypothetical protein